MMILTILKIVGSILVGGFAFAFVWNGIALVTLTSIAGTSNDLSLAWTRGAIYMCSGIIIFATLIHQLPTSSDAKTSF